jgi:hypothetical protein
MAQITGVEDTYFGNKYSNIWLKSSGSVGFILEKSGPS